jgi:hypothetical protein
MIRQSRTALKSFVIIVSSIMALLAGPCYSRDVTVILEEAQKQVSGNQMPEAIGTLREAIQGIWDQADLKVALCQLVEGPAKDYGMYTPRQSNLYNANSPIHLYVEPIGYNVIMKGDEMEFGLVADFAIKSSEGIELYDKKEFDSWVVKSRRFISEFSINLECNITGLKKGAYILEITLRDMNGASSAKTEKEIRIR